jgi:hypothetical protein
MERDRSLVQIKSHGQKVFKRLEKGENVFRKMEEHCGTLTGLIPLLWDSLSYASLVAGRLRMLVTEIHKGNNNIRQPSPSPPRPKNSDQILVASALCQLGHKTRTDESSKIPFDAIPTSAIK